MRRGPTMRMTVGSVVITWAALSGGRTFRNIAREPKLLAALQAANDLEHTPPGRFTPRLRLVSGGAAG
jgi:hypothetical protein